MSNLLLKRLSILVLFMLTAGPRLFAEAVLDATNYDAKWAVVIGINYENLPGESALPTLKFAEADAEEFHNLLTKHYGFEGENCTLLLGKNASRDAIAEKLDAISGNAGDDDCVVVYFSGHGFERKGNSANASEGELLPSDAQFKDGNPTAAKVIEMKWIVDHLTKQCKARHKLLILDCCYSGNVFQMGRGASVFDATRVDESVFRSPGLQAMTASRDKQKARDGKDGHSPFTDALLKAMLRVPTMQKKDKAFTTTELFSAMQWYFDQSLPADQSPRCSWLDGGQGEFHFYPSGDFPNPDVPDEQVRKVMLAMVPGSFGHWWFEETPWFMPGLRSEIVGTDEERRSVGLEMISPIRLEQAAVETRNKLVDAHKRSSDGTRDTVAKMRVEHLDMLLRAKGAEWDKVVKKVADDLEAVTARSDDQNKEDVADPTDLHYLAVLQHASGDKEYRRNAKLNYDRAIDIYEIKAEHAPQYKPLLALCLSDRGLYASTVEGNYEGACQFFAKARSVYGDLTPAPFQIYVLCREAEALSKLGQRGAARQRLKDAFEIASHVDPEKAYPLSAALYNASGWMNMNWCEFDKAIGDFTASTRILMSEQLKDDPEAMIMYLHNDHGVAMSLRYQGDAPRAIDLYGHLLQTIYDRLKTMRESTGRETNFRQLKARLTERWVNTLERCGDCSLFGNPSDIGEAADTYRRGLRAIGYLPAEKAPQWERKMRQKWALTLALPDSGIQDTALAAEQLEEILTLAKSMPQNAQSNDVNLVICDRITRLILKACDLQATSERSIEKTEQFNDDLSSFRQYLSELAKSNAVDSNLSRDDIEAAMFAMRIVINNFSTKDLPLAQNSKERIARLKDVDLLLKFCRLGRQGGNVVHFTRPYYDVAISALIDLEPKDSKQLIEVAWEAMTGKSHLKLRGPRPTLMLYCSADRNYFFLDVPHGPSAVYPLEPRIDFERILAAAHGGDSTQSLMLPAELRKELFAIEDEVSLCWRDRALQLGCDEPGRHLVNRPVAAPAGGTILTTGLIQVSSETPEETGCRFPFTIPSLVRVADEPIGDENSSRNHIAPGTSAALSSAQEKPNEPATVE